MAYFGQHLPKEPVAVTKNEQDALLILKTEEMVTPETQKAIPLQPMTLFFSSLRALSGQKKDE